MTKQNLSGQVAVLTGAGGGIGRAAAEKLAQEKMKIVLLGGNRLEKLEETRSLVMQYTDCLMLPGDLTDQAFLDEGVARVIQQYGRTDVLINNAGMALNCSFAVSYTHLSVFSAAVCQSQNAMHIGLF